VRQDGSFRNRKKRRADNPPTSHDSILFDFPPDPTNPWLAIPALDQAFPWDIKQFRLLITFS